MRVRQEIKSLNYKKKLRLYGVETMVGSKGTEKRVKERMKKGIEVIVADSHRKQQVKVQTIFDSTVFQPCLKRRRKK